MARTYPRRSTAERGYGPAHQAERKRRLAAYAPGDICAHGGEPLPWPRAVAARFLDLPHAPGGNGYLPGLACRRHNRGEGATRGNQLRKAARYPPAWRASRDW